MSMDGKMSTIMRDTEIKPISNINIAVMAIV
jgi:hypothetical protein